MAVKKIQYLLVKCLVQRTKQRNRWITNVATLWKEKKKTFRVGGIAANDCIDK